MQAATQACSAALSQQKAAGSACASYCCPAAHRNMLAKGNPEFCAILVAVNSVLQIVLYAPFALFYLQASIQRRPL